jgi:putative membrane protein
MRLLSLIALTFAVLIGVSFAVLNSETVTIHYYIGMQQIPLSILILGTLVLGIFIGWLISIPTIIRLKMEVKRTIRRHG